MIEPRTSPDGYLFVAEYAVRHGYAPSAVYGWIRLGWCPQIVRPPRAGWAIPMDYPPRPLLLVPPTLKQRAKALGLAFATYQRARREGRITRNPDGSEHYQRLAPGRPQKKGKPK